MKTFAFYFLFFFCGEIAAAQSKSFNVLDYGAVADSSVNSATGIQKAIDQCANAGGGTVVIPAGKFSTGTVYLKNHISLLLSEGAELYAIPDVRIYGNAKSGIENTGDAFIAGLVVALNASHISIRGAGSIIGLPKFHEVPVVSDDPFPGWTANARAYGVEMKAIAVDQPKISLVYISGCQDVQLSGVHIVNSPNWSCHIQWSSLVTIKNITIKSSLEKGVNSDGLDIDGCNHVLVEDCEIRTGDDAVCLKTTRQSGRSEKCEDVVVRNCKLSSTSCALKIGTETHADINRILFTHCDISQSNRGLGIFIRDGAHVHDVEFSDIRMECARKRFFWWGDGDAFQFVVLKRNSSSAEGSIVGLKLKNIDGLVEGSSLISGLHDSSIRHVQLSGIHISQRAESQPDKRAIHVLEIRQVSDITIDDIKLERDTKNKESKWGSLLLVSNVNGFSLKNDHNLKQANSPYPYLEKVNVQDSQK